MSLSPGTKLGRYEIRSKIGAGGMGEVYLAYDDELQRSVAIKILPAALSQDQQRMQRFVQEARSASALNHPNILTIYEVGKTEGVHFIATEFIDGENLRDHFQHTHIKLGDLLDIATQISSALGKAHNSGIIHRDIKPENIMVTRDGYVKVLDFGLSKLTEQPTTTDLDAPTQALIDTEPGKVMGTTRYMSPEQARGLRIDPRSDIWSLGVVLYEALTGRPPFEGTTNTDLIVSILEREPAPIARFNPDVPHQFDRIIRKTLAKDPEERYQVIKDLQIDLKNLKRELELEAEIDRTLPPEVRAATLSTKGTTQSQVETILSPIAVTAPTKSVSSAEYVVTGLKRHKTATLLSVGLIALVAGGIFLLVTRRAPALTDKDTILLADFANTTGDAVFDGTLKQALAVQLGQSPYLSIAPDDRIRETLRFMNRSPDERLTRDIAREICQRQGVKALLAGTISSLGSNYVLTLEALNAQSGNIFAREQVEAASKEEVLKALGTIASKLREKLGESLASIEKFDAPIEQATTSSLEALKAFSLGDEKRSTGKYDEAIPFYQRATEIDPNFALAYARLSIMHFNLRESEKTKQYAEKAFALRDRVSEHEKFYISASYYQNVLGDIEKTIETLELWRQTYPRDYVPLNNVAVNYSFLGEFEKQLEAARESLRINPNTASPYTNIGWAYLRLNRFDEAAKTIEQAMAQDKVSLGLRGLMFTLASLKGDAEGMKQQVDWAAGKPLEPIVMDWQAAALFNSGRITEARELRRKGIELALRRDQKDVAARLHLAAATMETALGNCGAAVQEINAALTVVKGKEQMTYGTFVFAVCGASGVEAMANDLATRFPRDTATSAVVGPSIRAALEMNRNNPAKAIEILEPVRRYELGEFAQLWPNYLRGLAYMKLGRPREAATEFQKILDHHPITFYQSLHPIAQLNLARAWADLANDKAQSGNSGSETPDAASRESALVSARKAYQDFLAMWKDADANTPLVQQAKAEYARLRSPF
jgi:serine/threonine protein kinase/tetratricopeptide (TPR) repeat protein